MRTAARLTCVGAVGALSLTACAGGVGEAGTGAQQGDGFEYGAPQEEVDALVADLEPVTLRFQPGAASEASIMSPTGTAIKELIEERSDGRITVELVWGQAVAGFDTVHDALADGRLDIANTLPGYSPAEYPAFDDLSTTTALLPSSPFAGSLIAYAVYSDLGWQNPQILEEFEAEGLVPLTPFVPTAENYTICREPLEDTADWQGLQVRIGSAAQSAQVSQLGASPVSMEFTEMFEALERGTVECNLGPGPATAESGVLEVAPHLGFTTATSFPRTGTTMLAGSSFAELPLAYQQIVFDSSALGAAGFVQSYADSAAEVVRQAREFGGSVSPLPEDTQEQMRVIADSLTADAVADGGLDPETVDALTSGIETWTTRLEELGYADAGAPEEFDEWYDPETDFREYARAVYESGAAMEHRPGT